MITVLGLENFGEWVMWKHFATSDFPCEYNVTLFWRTVDRIDTYVLPSEIP